MHELSVALSLLDQITDAAERDGSTDVVRVRLRVGRMSGIARDALLFSWDLARADTVARNADLIIEDVEALVYCPQCDSERVPLAGAGFTCGACGALAPSLVRGRELELVAMEVAA